MNTYAFHGLTTNETLTLCRRVLDVAGGRTLHPKIRRAADDVRAKLDLLDAASDAVDVEGDPPAGVRDAMLTLRGTLARFASALRAFGEMPVDDARVVAAREAYAVVFPHGTTFLSGTAADLEVEGGRALDRAREPATRASLASLGFAPVVKQARKELGRLCAAGVATAAVPEEVATRANGLTALQEASAALREYARIVQAVDVVDCTSERHALLAPFVHHRVTKAKRAQAPEPPVVRAANDADADEAPPSRAA